MAKSQSQDSDKLVALRHARRIADQAELVNAEMRGTILLCSRAGASLREIADATGLSHMTIKRTIDRAAALR